MIKEIREITKKQREDADKLLSYFENEFKVNILDKVRIVEVVEMRSLFNTLLRNKLRFRCCDIKRYYLSKGFKVNHASIYHSLNRFEIYSWNSEHLKEKYYILYRNGYEPKEIFKKEEVREKSLTPIQKLLDNMEEWQEKELEELIKLRIKSWQWKNKNETKIYTAN